MTEKRLKERIQMMSSEGELIIVDRNVAKRFVGESRMGNENEHLHFENVRSIVLRKLILWSYYHRDDPQPELSDTQAKQWYNQFFDEDQKILLELAETADALEIKRLSHIARQRLLDGTTPKNN
ncbi:E3 ubiquitin ligase complex SCF subunit scon-3-like [Drosophila persimilis]|uniref:E3 ubiquitin ligase complex SCF subunit scon-3-like n=1 Tax=Drosophila persimilis TaxID=7234 RepID=UPI000F08A0D7|nr:E3 ubiquitin ligase complex SCF subunit scon-3-like [Drosophila persimilis]XP_026846336.1 E3 ubiquitin ligase complex SCF subunit scon-3-like [Drosophila persimilis]